MRKILYLIILLPILSNAQDWRDHIVLTPITHTTTGPDWPGWELQFIINEYERDCNRLVLDTITQEGVIEYEHIPVKDRNGKVLHYAIGNPDTVWYNVVCPTYKDKENLLLFDGRSLRSDGSYGNVRIEASGSGRISSINNSPIPGSSKAEPYKVGVERKYVCEVKKRKIVPFSKHFWQWIKEHPKK